VDISPAAVQAGSLSLSLAMEPARHMLDQAAATTSDPDLAHQASSPSSNLGGSTAYVLQGLLQLTNNFNPAQPIPDDMPQAMLRHVNVQIRGAAGGDTIPYLSASMDMLLDGHATITNVPLVPMIDGEAASPQLYYGNNVKLTQRGNYQVFVRILPNALLGKDALPAAQFNVAVQ
jgi:hypothetical protein